MKLAQVASKRKHNQVDYIIFMLIMGSFLYVKYLRFREQSKIFSRTVYCEALEAHYAVVIFATVGYNDINTSPILVNKWWHIRTLSYVFINYNIPHKFYRNTV